MKSDECIQLAYKVNNKLKIVQKESFAVHIATRDLDCSDCQASTCATNAGC